MLVAVVKTEPGGGASGVVSESDTLHQDYFSCVLRLCKCQAKDSLSYFAATMFQVPFNQPFISKQRCKTQRCNSILA